MTKQLATAFTRWPERRNTSPPYAQGDRNNDPDASSRPILADTFMG
jgi:hypothetical protein